MDPVLKKLTLHNFQTHKSYVLEFDKKVTSIVGPSDLGKTALIRALYWVCFNDPSGDEMIRWGSGFSRVILELDNHIIKRQRGKENFYTLDDKVFKAFGNDVPPQVTKVLNVGEVNFQQQLDPHFWFSSTPGQVSRDLNQIVNLGLLDRSLGRIASRLRTARATVSVGESRLAVARKTKADLAWAPAFAAQALKLQQCERKRIKLLGSMVALQNDIDDIEESQKLAEQAVPDMAKLSAAKKNIEVIVHSITDLDLAIYEIQNSKADVLRLEAQLKTAEEQLSKVKVCPTCGQAVSSQ
jgi:exonuclease SbcC